MQGAFIPHKRPIILKLSVAVLFLSSLLLTASHFQLLAEQKEKPFGHGQPWLGPDGEVLPFQSYQEIEEFLHDAEIISIEEIPTGVTLPKKLLLEQDGIRMHAVFRHMDFSKRRWKSSQGLRLNFRDSYLFECAAYELGKILGIENIPPVVLREVDSQKGSVQAWVENAITEEKRLKEKMSPPHRINWLYQVQVMRVFDNLIYNDDRNQGNYLYDKNWRLWMIDFTRAFQPAPELKDPEKILYCERDLLYQIKNLTEESVQNRLQETGLLTEGQVRTLFKRKEKLVEYIEEMVAEKGQGAVLYSFIKPKSSKQK